MAIKNALLGGTDNVNGDIIDADDMNDTFDAAVIKIDDNTTNLTIHRKVMSNSDPVATTNYSSFDSVISDTFGILNGLLIGIHFKCKLKSNNNGGYMQVKLSGTNLGSYFINLSPPSNERPIDSPYIGTTDTHCVFLGDSSNTYFDFGINIACGLKLLDASTTVDIGIKGITPGTATCDDVEIILVYQNTFTDD